MDVKLDPSKRTRAIQVDVKDMERENRKRAQGPFRSVKPENTKWDTKPWEETGAKRLHLDINERHPCMCQAVPRPFKASDGNNEKLLK